MLAPSRGWPLPSAPGAPSPEPGQAIVFGTLPEPRISPDSNDELSAGKLGSRIGVDISNLWFVFRRPCSTPARPLAQTANRPVAASRRKPHRDLDCNAILRQKAGATNPPSTRRQPLS